jgi:hypothetical protein
MSPVRHRLFDKSTFISLFSVDCGYFATENLTSPALPPAA